MPARSHGNGADSEQLVFVFFGRRAAGPLPGSGGVRQAEPPPDRCRYDSSGFSGHVSARPRRRGLTGPAGSAGF